jgi:hypothetical protein
MYKLKKNIFYKYFGPDDSEFDFRTAMNIWGKLRKRHTFVQCILVEKAKESTEKSISQCSPFLLSDRWLFFVADFYSVFLFFRRCA